MSPPDELDPLFLSFQLALAGKYSIEREIGRGGMGIVYLAREVHLDRPVAIKLLPPDRAAEDMVKGRFLREARLAAKLSHPNVIPIHSVAEVGGYVFYVMAYVDGETLTQRVRGRGPLPPSEGTRVIRETAWALGHAHEHGLIHRDVKPDNILLERSSGRALVADFGIAAALSDKQASGEYGVTGTPEFMSPEQGLGNELDARSDLYSLGATAYYAFSGRLPFEGATPTEVIAKHITQPAPALASLGLAVPRKVALLVDRCLAKERDHRPTSAEALAEQLGVALEQKRELPAILRGFVKREGRIDGLPAVILPGMALGAAIGIAAKTSMLVGFGSMAVALVAFPALYLARRTRDLMGAGFAHADIGPAFREQIEQAREEFIHTGSLKASPTERALRTIAATTGPIGGALLLKIIFDLQTMASAPPATRGPSELLVLGMVLSTTTCILATMGWLQLLQRRTDVDTEFWERVWTGPIGKAIFAIGRKMVGKKMLGTAMTHRATELSLGLAAEQLYEALPKVTRAQLRDLPPTLKRLQADAQLLRHHVNELNESLSDAGDAAASSEYDDVRTTRDELQTKLGDAVGALETIRLNLLRLHAGSGTVEGLTTHLGLAVEVSEAVARLISAQSEVDKTLKFPREIASTPA